MAEKHKTDNYTDGIIGWSYNLRYQTGGGVAVPTQMVLVSRLKQD